MARLDRAALLLFSMSDACVEPATLHGRDLSREKRAFPASLLWIQRSRLALSVLPMLCNATRDPLTVSCNGNLLRAQRARIRFVDIPAHALDVAALRGTVRHGTRGLVSMVGHGGPLLS
jgi:hypothetical protein